MTTDAEYLNTTALAKHLGVHPSTIWRWDSFGMLPKPSTHPCKRGRKRGRKVWRKSEIDQWYRDADLRRTRTWIPA